MILPLIRRIHLIDRGLFLEILLPLAPELFSNLSVNSRRRGVISVQNCLLNTGAKNYIGLTNVRNVVYSEVTAARVGLSKPLVVFGSVRSAWLTKRSIVEIVNGILLKVKGGGCCSLHVGLNLHGNFLSPVLMLRKVLFARNIGADHFQTVFGRSHKGRSILEVGLLFCNVSFLHRPAHNKSDRRVQLLVLTSCNILEHADENVMALCRG